MARVAWRNLSYWKKVGTFIRGARKWRDMTEVQVSNKLGIELKDYRKIERGQTESVTLEQIYVLKKYFRVSIEQLIPLL